MVSCTSATVQLGTYGYNALHTVATESGNGVPGRPGVNPLRRDIIYHVTPEQYEVFKKINEQWVQPSVRPLSPLHPKINREEISFMNCRVVADDHPSVEHIPLKQDVEGNLQSIRNAKRNAALVVFSNHSHEIEPALTNEWGKVPAQFIRDFYKQCIDAGADIVYGHGDHAGQGIELYKGKPIFYSLANPIVTSQNVKRLCLEEYERYAVDRDDIIAEWMYRRWAGGNKTYANDWWVKTIVPTFTMVDGELTELKLHPIDASAGEEFE
jgi:poly-gamma-glutamate synthesis protein (capsule biosynthesis protein)